MARKSILEASTVAATRITADRRLLPGEWLPERASAIFSEIVGSVSPGHFSPADRPLLEQLAVALQVARSLADDIDRHGTLDEDGKVRQAVKVLKQQQALCGQLASRLRLTTQARISREKATSAAKGGKSSISELYEIGA